MKTWLKMNRVIKTGYFHRYSVKPLHTGYVRGSPNGKICKFTNGNVNTIFTNGNQTLNVFLLPLVPLVRTIGRSHGGILSY